MMEYRDLRHPIQAHDRSNANTNRARKRLLQFVVGMLVLVLSACASAPDQTPTPVATQTQGVVSQTPEMPSASPVATGTAGIPVTGADLANTKWRLISFGEHGSETPVIEATEVTLEFEANGQAGGSASCNPFGAQYSVQDGALAFQEIVVTHTTCLVEDARQQESRYLAALEDARTFELIEDQLLIRYGDEGGVLNFVSFESEPSPTPASNLLCSTVGEGSKPGWSLCRSQDFGFEVQYPPNAELIDHTTTSTKINLPFPADVNLTEKYLTISATEDEGTCSSPLTEGRPAGSFSREPVQMNGVEFTKETGQEAATGSVYNWEAYSIGRNAACISLSFVLRSFRPQLEATPPPQFDLEEESRIFTEIVSTFEWLETPPPPVSEAQRIEFAPGTTSATVTGQLRAAGADQYVLRALGEQTMKLDLTFTQGAAILAVWGEDGTVLLSDHAEISNFKGVLPTTQDYFILVKGRPNGSTIYNMTISIPPLP